MHFGDSLCSFGLDAGMVLFCLMQCLACLRERAFEIGGVIRGAARFSLFTPYDAMRYTSFFMGGQLVACLLVCALKFLCFICGMVQFFGSARDLGMQTAPPRRGRGRHGIRLEVWRFRVLSRLQR